MSSPGQQSSSRQKDKATAERLTPLQEKESENADLRRQVRDFRQEIDEVRTKCEDLEAEQKAKNEVIERLSNHLSRRELEIDSEKERNAQLQGLLQDSFQTQYQELRASKEGLRASNERLRASNERYQSKLADARKVMDKESGPVTLAASKTAETKERANPPQVEQSGSHSHAEELESQKTSQDTTEDPLFSTNFFRPIDPDDHLKKNRGPKKPKALDQKPANTRYVAPPPANVKSDEQSRAGLTISTPRPVSSSAPATNFSTLTGTGGGGSGDRHGSKMLPSKGHIAVVPKSEDVGSLATPQEAESVRDYALVAAEPAAPALVDDGWTYHPGLSKARRAWFEMFGLIPEKNPAKEDTEREQKPAEPSESSEHLTLGVDGSSMSRSGQSEAATLGDKLMQFADEDMPVGHGPRRVDNLGKDDGVKATTESNQPDVESTKAKRSFSQSFGEPEVSRKRTKTDEK